MPENETTQGAMSVTTSTRAWPSPLVAETSSRAAISRARVVAASAAMVSRYALVCAGNHRFVLTVRVGV